MYIGIAVTDILIRVYPCSSVAKKAFFYPLVVFGDAVKFMGVKLR
jgi:hypothetical protein